MDASADGALVAEGGDLIGAQAEVGREHVDTAIARGRTLDKDAAVELLREALDAVELQLDNVD